MTMIVTLTKKIAMMMTSNTQTMMTIMTTKTMTTTMTKKNKKDKKQEKKEKKEYKSIAAPLMRRAKAGKRAGMAALRRLKKY